MALIRAHREQEFFFEFLDFCFNEIQLRSFKQRFFSFMHISLIKFALANVVAENNGCNMKVPG